MCVYILYRRANILISKKKYNNRFIRTRGILLDINLFNLFNDTRHFFRIKIPEWNFTQKSVKPTVIVLEIKNFKILRSYTVVFSNMSEGSIVYN